ncbi:MAG: hypothetical protein KIG62_09880 [Oscillospiraceae bacterium]|nr:hypothetical protein [Oscillospiraceae bacterium]
MCHFPLSAEGRYKDGKLSDIADDIIQTLSSYTEISPSGEGIRIIFRSKQGAKFLSLWNGVIPQGKSHSEADIMLCRILAFWCCGITAQMDRLFRQSRLYRGKWERADYRNSTLNRAVSSRTNFYKG